MPVASNIRKCNTLINKLLRQEYFPYIKNHIDSSITNLINEKINNGLQADEAEKQSYIDVFKELTTILQNSQTDVDAYIEDKVNSGTIHNADQARKSVAGNLFQQSVAYLIAKNVLNGNITKPITVTTSVKSILTQYAQIDVDGEKQMPDSDIVIYTDVATDPILNLSCKTSFRERAGQTYKWKLLLDLATCTCPHKTTETSCPSTIYNLNYAPTKAVKVGFVTADLYNEITNPQISGMFSFFDYAYIGKETGATNINTLDNIISDINNLF